MDKRTIIAFVLIGLILFFYGDYVKWVSPPPPPQPADTTAVAADAHSPLIEGPGSLGSPVEELDSSPATVADSIPQLPERVAVVETDRYILRISSVGAQIKSLKLKPYGRYLTEGVEMIPDDPGARPGYRFWTRDGAVETASLKFQLEDDEGAGDVGFRVKSDGRDTIRFFAPLGGGTGVRIRYIFNGSNFNFLTSMEGVGLANVVVRDYAEALWQGGLAFTETDSAQDKEFSRAYTYFAGDILEEQEFDHKKTTATTPTEGRTLWGAVRTKYFMVAALPESAPAVGSWMESRRDSSYVGDFPPNRLGFGLRIPVAQGSIVTPVRYFAGPLDVALLKQTDPTLTRTMNWGWKIIAPFSKAILWGLRNLYTVIPNYGFAIIIFSVLIKVLLWPLTHKSYTSMAAMQRVQPKLQALRDKYKGDPQRLNKEMMKLYKEEKINPMGGCLPMLLQLPLLYALFIVFRSTIEFRQAPFGLWITDLSMPDYVWELPFAIPFYGSHFAVLPVLMAISTYYQSKPTMTDPNQKFLLYFMPVMMLVLFNSFPSGLNLYYTLFNLLTLVQMKIIPLPKAAPAAANE